MCLGIIKVLEQHCTVCGYLQSIQTKSYDGNMNGRLISMHEEQEEGSRASRRAMRIVPTKPLSLAAGQQPPPLRHVHLELAA